MYMYEKCNDVDTIKFDTQYESQVAGVHMKNISTYSKKIVFGFT